MRFRHPDGSTVHLAYCTNVHPAEDLDGVLDQLRHHCEPVRRRLGRDRLGIGLWLARDAARTLTADPAALRRPAHRTRPARPGGRHPQRLPVRGLRRRGGQVPRVPAGLDGARTADPHQPTSPGCWPPCSRTTSPRAASPRSRSPGAPPFDPDRRRAALAPLSPRSPTGLDALEDLTGRSIRIGLEPEPGCIVETTAHAIAALTALPEGAPAAASASASTPATSPPPFEDPHTATAALAAAGVPVVKAQLSAALHAEDPHRPAVRTALAAFAEPRFLHQTRTRTAAGVRGTDDLDRGPRSRALPDDRRPLARPLPRPAARRRPSRRSPPPCPSSRTPSPGWSAARRRSPATWRSRRTPGRRCRPSCGPATATGWPTASPPNSPWPATC